MTPDSENTQRSAEAQISAFGLFRGIDGLIPSVTQAPRGAASLSMASGSGGDWSCNSALRRWSTQITAALRRCFPVAWDV